MPVLAAVGCSSFPAEIDLAGRAACDLLTREQAMRFGFSGISAEDGGDTVGGDSLCVRASSPPGDLM
ncbi:hypothetical protein [Marinactinospora rubrisoli]|uniref:Uncharacterized protein n=1 Tax=Marinactinospora rubrisoli TaxID=2715399 RepID=A0ABW2KN02_9ACTN